MQERHIFAARERDRRDAEQRQPDTCRHKAQHRMQRVISGSLPERGREDEIARPEVDGEHHEAERQQILFFQRIDSESLHGHIQIFQKVQPALLQNQRLVSNFCAGK